MLQREPNAFTFLFVVVAVPCRFLKVAEQFFEDDGDVVVGCDMIDVMVVFEAVEVSENE